MARVLAIFDDLLLGSNVLGMLRAAGELGSTRTIGVYSHVDVDTRRRAEAAGFDLIVPRSRMAREGPKLVSGLAS